MNIHLSFLNLATIYFTFITLTLPLHAKCLPFNVNPTYWTWELHVFGAKGCARNLGYLIMGGQEADDHCIGFKNITLTGLNDVQSLNFASDPDDCHSDSGLFISDIGCNGKAFANYYFWSQILTDPTASTDADRSPEFQTHRRTDRYRRVRSPEFQTNKRTGKYRASSVHSSMSSNNDSERRQDPG
ncbi:hypothetical protein BJ138DRAFT_1118519 [Hygrophoropsis aurantiaca]|uniref:Uncharacterized protein n=1 Tax=Hygrophoropsis aurantiaca TaxID=72124 RepID=A0ACB7ZW61_9AGAM|nr:hypothetical protein BJ138DRAFT_1118519 [Hygrophoropsis aurantiaca]